MRVIVLTLKISMWTSVDSYLKGSNTSPKHVSRPYLWVHSQSMFSEKLILGPMQFFPLVPINPSPANPSSYSPLDLTRAPLLSRIMKMMKVSNQLCSTMRKQVFRRIHQDLPSPSSMFTWQHLNRWTQPGTSGRGRSDRGCMPHPALPSPPSPRPHQVLPQHTARSTVDESECLIQSLRGLQGQGYAARLPGPSRVGKMYYEEAVREEKGVVRSQTEP